MSDDLLIYMSSREASGANILNWEDRNEGGGKGSCDSLADLKVTSVTNELIRPWKWGKNTSKASPGFHHEGSYRD